MWSVCLAFALGSYSWANEVSSALMLPVKGLKLSLRGLDLKHYLAGTSPSPQSGQKRRSGGQPPVHRRVFSSIALPHWAQKAKWFGNLWPFEHWTCSARASSSSFASGLGGGSSGAAAATSALRW